MDKEDLITYIYHIFLSIYLNIYVYIYTHTTQPYQTWNNGLVQIQKGVRPGCILSPHLFNFYAEHIMRNAGLDEAQAGLKIAGISISNLRYADDTTLMAENEE